MTNPTTLQQASALQLPGLDPVTAAARSRVASLSIAAASQFFGPDASISEITTERMQQWEAALIEQGRNHRTIDRFLVTLRSVLARAHRAGLLEQLPDWQRSPALIASRQASWQEAWDRVKARRSLKATQSI